MSSSRVPDQQNRCSTHDHHHHRFIAPYTKPLETQFFDRDYAPATAGVQVSSTLDHTRVLAHLSHARSAIAPHVKLTNTVCVTKPAGGFFNAGSIFRFHVKYLARFSSALRYPSEEKDCLCHLRRSSCVMW
jgi:hypothetical protein